MASIDSISLLILFGAVLVLAGILSSVVALRFGGPLLLIFLIVGMLAGEAGPLGIEFDNVRMVYTVGSIALALILFDGGLRTRFATFRSVLLPAGSLATIGVLVSSAIVAPVAIYAFELTWTEGLLVGAMVASTDAAAVFFLMHARGLRLRPRVGATIEVESGTNDPFAIFLTIVLVEILLQGAKPWTEIASLLVREAVVGACLGYLGGYAITLVLNRVTLPQGLQAPFVATAAIVIFGLCQSIHASGFLAVYLAGLIVGNRALRTHNAIVVFLDAVTWLAQIVMFVLFGLLAWPSRLPDQLLPALAVALTLMLVARPAAVFLCLAPFGFSFREKLFTAWVGLRGAVGFFLASIPLLVGLPKADTYFDIGFVVVVVSLLVQGWTVPFAARRLRIAKRRPDIFHPRVEIDLPGQRNQELVGYPIVAGSPYLRRGITPPWAKLTLVVRGENVLTPEESRGIHEGDHVYLLAPPEKAQALDRFFADLPPPKSPDPQLLGDFFVSGEITLGALAELYGLEILDTEKNTSIADYFTERLSRQTLPGDRIAVGAVALVAHRVKDARAATIGLQLAESEVMTLRNRIQSWFARLLTK
jgi:cell volume regulation protein A